MANRDRFVELYRSRGWVMYDRISTELIAQAVAVPVEEGDEVLTDYHLDPRNHQVLGYRFKAPHFRPWYEIYERAIERANAADYLSAIPLALSIIDGVCTTMSGKHPFSGGADAPVFDSETSGPGGLADGLALLGSTRRKLDVEPIEAPFRHGIVHGLNPNYGHPLVAAKTFNLLQATVDYFDRRRDEADRIEKAAKDQQPPSFRELSEGLRRNAELKQAISSWEARPDRSDEEIAKRGGVASIEAGSPEAVACQYLEALCARNYGELAKMTVDYPKRSIGYRAGRLRDDLNGFTVADWTITGVRDTAPATSLVSLRLAGEFGGDAWNVDEEMRLIYADEDYNGLARGQSGGTWVVMPNFLTNLWAMGVRSRENGR